MGPRRKIKTVILQHLDQRGNTTWVVKEGLSGEILELRPEREGREWFGATGRASIKVLRSAPRVQVQQAGKAAWLACPE